MATKTISTRKYKKQKLRNAEYYQMQEILDQLYEDSLQNKNFKNLYDLIISEENIKLAFRTIKNNKGSYTRGCNKTNIINIKENEVGKVIKYVRNRLEDFRPHKVRRVFIPKPDGRLRPLGIPSIEDRLIQQCFKQILEPICEAKFYKHSYGFRPNRSTKHAIARVHQLINTSGMKYCVDIDLKSFFDNVNHGKLLKQIWSLGIRDKKVISIISKMLKAEIEGEGIPTKGIPQGGILSPLLANIVLNEMDWWIASQWETFPINKEYANDYSRIRHLRENTKLKEIHFVRYADDFKIFCKDYETASRINIATRKWLKERL
jgi:group II intron reverse transcriptase/maturase